MQPGQPGPNGPESSGALKTDPFAAVLGSHAHRIRTESPGNALSFSGEKWGFGMLPPHGMPQRVMPNAEAYTVLSRIHPQEIAFMVVSPSSYFAQTDTSGAFSLPDVPAKTNELVAWAPRLKLQRQTVVVNGGQAVSFLPQR